MINVPIAIIKLIIKRNLKKQAIRTVQRQVGINKFAGLVRRFDKRKTFVKNLKSDPKQMVVKMFKQYAKRKVLGLLPPARFVINWAKYGIKEAMKRIMFKALPTDIKKPYYLLKGIKDPYEKVKLITYGKKIFWEEIEKLSIKRQAETLDRIIEFDPSEDIELKKYWDEVLDKDIHFKVNSPMTNNFSQLEISYNIATKVLYLPIRGYAGRMVKTYKFQDIPWELIKQAMKGADFGVKIYSQFRSSIADQKGRFWANLDPYYKR